MVDEILETGLGDGELIGHLKGLSASNFVWVALVLALHVSLNIVVGLFNIAGNIEGISGRLWDGETVVKSNACRHGTETYSRRVSRRKL